MKKTLATLAILVAALAVCAVRATTQNIYIDLANDSSSYILDVTLGATNDVVFHVMNDGAAIATAGHTPILKVGPTDRFPVGETSVVEGSATNSTATFSMTNLNPVAKMDGWFAELSFRTNTYTFSHAKRGKVQVGPRTVSAGGDVRAAIRLGGFAPAYQTDATALTTNTVYKPAFVGQFLYGSAGTGTNAVWIAKGTGTNDWVKLAP